MRRETLETPAVIVVMSRVHDDEITREEDYAAVMMATANLMTAAQSLGLGTYLKTGGVMRDPALARTGRFPEGYRIVGMLSVGYPAEAESPAPAAPAGELTAVAGVSPAGCYGARVFEVMFAIPSGGPRSRQLPWQGDLP